MTDARLNEFTKDEWWDVCRKVRPDISREEYEALWDGFIALKQRKALQ